MKVDNAINDHCDEWYRKPMESFISYLLLSLVTVEYENGLMIERTRKNGIIYSVFVVFSINSCRKNGSANLQTRR
jgi:hypothetical protein